MFLAAGLLAAAVSFAANRFLFRRLGNASLVVPIPLVEEATKTVSALWLGAGIFHTHLFFGLVEAALEWRRRQNGVMAALLSAASHCVFGLLASAVHRETGVPAFGILASFSVHAAVNTMVLLRAAKR